VRAEARRADPRIRSGHEGSAPGVPVLAPANGVWVVEADQAMRSRLSNSDPPKSELRAAGACGHFSADVAAELERRPALIGRIAQRVLDAHFPETLHKDILAAVGLEVSDLTESTSRLGSGCFDGRMANPSSQRRSSWANR
jgi:hypothetical protein